MKRRSILSIAGGATLGAALPVLAQTPPKVWRIGLLSQSIPRSFFEGTLIKDLAEAGYVEGRNLVIEFRFAQDDASRLNALAAELVAAKVDLLLAPLPPEIAAAKRATSTIPIVMMFGLAPVETGLIASLARPGGNVTGTTSSSAELGGKAMELFNKILPRGARVTLLFTDPDAPSSPFYQQQLERAASALGLRLTVLPIRTVVDLDSAFKVMERERPDGMLVRATGVAIGNSVFKIIDFAAKHHIPAHYGNQLNVRMGGLMSYSVDFVRMRRRLISIIDRVVKGANPAELPVEEPTNFWLVINLKTAKTLGLTIPQSLLLLADEVIE